MVNRKGTVAMLGLNILEVALGLCFIYFLGSTIASAFVELVSQLFSQRARQLEKGISELLGAYCCNSNSEDAKRVRQLTKAVLDNPLIMGLASEANSWIRRIPVVSWLSRRLMPQIDRPSYIPAHLFSKALIEAMQPAYAVVTPSYRNSGATAVATPPATGLAVPASLESVLQSFRAEDLKTSLENWYDAKMERVSGAYKRWSQVWLLFIALLLSVTLNLDTVKITQTLWTNDGVRQVLVANATSELNRQNQTSGDASRANQTATVATSPLVTIEEYRKLLKDQEQAGLPIGWHEGELNNLSLGQILSKILGFLLTTLALSLGAPFWFDTLNKVANLRSVGKSPEPDNAKKVA